MKKINIIARNILITSMFLIGINQVIFAGPYVKLCFITCQYSHASSQFSMCTGEVQELFATACLTGLPCLPCNMGTRQWYTFIYGFHCHDMGGKFLCHNGAYPSTIEGATSNSYTVTTAGKYWCAVDCGDGLVFNTDTVEFFYDTGVPTISNHPQDQNICEGTTASFSIGVSSNYKSYSWQKMVPSGSWTNISGANLSSYSYTPPAGDDLSQFRCAVYNGCGTAYSNAATLDIKFKPAISQNPSDASVCSGTSSNFSIGATGDGLAYQWQLSTNGGTDWGNIFTSGQYSVNDNQMSVSDITGNMSGYIYRCMVSGNCSPSAISSGATLTVKTSPVITSSPLNNEKCAGETATFKVQATGTVPMEYYWRKDEGSGSWSSSAEYTIPAVSIGDAGSYDVLIRNECYPSGVESNNATLTVHALPTVSLGEDKHICEGSDLVLDAGSGLTGYDWSTGETTRTITVNAEDEYSVTVTDNNNCSNSDNILIYIDPKIPSVNLGDDLAICLGEKVILDAGSGYDYYTWNTGGTRQVLSVTETGDYSVEVSNWGNVCKSNDVVHVLVAEPFKDEKICLVTVDPKTEKNMVIWEKTENKGTASYNIYRESTSADKYDLLGNVPFENLSVFVDYTSQPKLKSHKYKISVIDTCGNETDTLTWSPYHKTLLLTSNLGPNSINLDWDEYKVEFGGFGFVKYYIYRGKTRDNMTIIDSLASDSRQYPDYNPPAGRLYYRIAGVKSEVCDPANLLGKKADSGPYSHSMSNIEDNRLQVGFNNLKSAGALTIYPNPAADFVTIGFSNPEQFEYQLIVRDLAGKTVLIINNINEDKVVIERGNLKAGYYSVEVSGEEIYRGKLIIE
jgi:hypothetical protein